MKSLAYIDDRVPAQDTLAGERQFRERFAVPVCVKLRTCCAWESIDSLSEGILDKAWQAFKTGNLDEPGEIANYVRALCDEVCRPKTKRASGVAQ